jgi:hypothetical protein
LLLPGVTTICLLLHSLAPLCRRAGMNTMRFGAPCGTAFMRNGLK